MTNVCRGWSTVCGTAGGGGTEDGGGGGGGGGGRGRGRLAPKPRKKKASGKVFLFIKEKGSIRNEILSNFVFLLKLSLRIKTPVCFDDNVPFCKSRPKKTGGESPQHG